MTKPLHDFFAVATAKAATDLGAALLRIPEDKRNWAPAEKARTALDQVAECIVLNGYTATMIQTREWSPAQKETFMPDKTAVLALDAESLITRLTQSAGQVIDALQAVPETDLGAEIAMPWGPMTLTQVMAYPYWNMSYHEGQINYIASILDCLS